MVIRRRILNEEDDCERCFYCDRLIFMYYHEHDHFPVPGCADGDRVVPACLHCHDLKDRIAVFNWPAELFVTASREMLKFDLIPTLGSPREPACWRELDWSTKLLWAKLSRYLLDPKKVNDSLPFFERLQDTRLEYLKDVS